MTLYIVVPPGIEPGTQGFSVLIVYPCKWLSSSSKTKKSSLVVETFWKTTGLLPWLFTLVCYLCCMAEKALCRVVVCTYNISFVYL